MAGDIYTAAGWESMYQNGYLHGSPSKFSAKSAIYKAAGCQHIITIYTAAVPEQIQTINTAAMCSHKIAIYTAAILEPNRLYTLLPGVYKNRSLPGSRSRAKSAIYIAAGCIQKIVIYTAAVQEPNRLWQRIYTRLPGGSPCIKMIIYTAALQKSQPNRLYKRLPGQHIIAIYTAAVPEQIQTIYTAAVCQHKIAFYTAAIQEPNRLYTLLPGVYKKSLFTRQPFKSQIGYIHCCRV